MRSSKPLDVAVANFLVLVVFLFFSLVGAGATGRLSPLAGAAVATVYAYTQVKNSPAAAVRTPLSARGHLVPAAFSLLCAGRRIG